MVRTYINPALEYIDNGPKSSSRFIANIITSPLVFINTEPPLRPWDGHLVCSNRNSARHVNNDGNAYRNIPCPLTHARLSYPLTYVRLPNNNVLWHMQDTIMSSDIYMQDILQQRPLTYSLASSDICKMPRQRPLTYARHQEWHPLTCVQDASNMTVAPSTILRNFLCLSLCAAISITTTIHDRLPRHRQLCIRSCQSIHVIIVIYDTPAMTAGGNRGERRDNTKKGQRHRHRCRTILQRRSWW